MAKAWSTQSVQSCIIGLTLVIFFVNPTYSSVCSKEFMVKKRRISSPNYPYRYFSNANCTWIIKSPLKDHEIVLKFRDLEIEPQTLCNFDYIQIGSGSIPGQNIITNKICGIRKPGPIKSDSGALWLRFVSDGEKEFRGFRATWKTKKTRQSQAFPNPAIENNVCGETHLNGIEGTIKSPKFPRKYPYDQQCHWIIKAPRKNRLVIRFEYFDLEGASKCRFDYLVVKDGEYNNSKTIGRYCGSSKPATITTSSNTANIHFTSDTSIARGGFLIRWKAVDPLIATPTAVVVRTRETMKPTTTGPNGVPKCNELQFTSNKGRINSPLYPNFYPEDIQCTWIISVEKPSQIRLTFGTEFDLENAEHCTYDFISIRDGANAVDKEIGRYCGQDSPESILSSSSSLRITFHSDKSGVGKGFLLEWVAVNVKATFSTLTPITKTPECGGHLTEETGVITSPDYPMMYPSEQNCVWLLSMASGSQVRLTFDYFDLEDNLNCAYDYLLVRDGIDAHSPVIGRFCGPSTLISEKFLYSSGEDLRIEFHSDISGSKGGFHLSWDSILKGTTKPTLATTPTVLGKHRIMTGCGGIFEPGLHGGTIFSPAYPGDYAPNLSCTWTIQVDDESQVALSFNEFELENTVECSSDYVIVKDGISENADVLGKYCGTDVPVYLLSSENDLSVTFHTDSVNSARGFEISWMKYNPNPSGPARTPLPVNEQAPICVNELGSLSGASALSVNDRCQWNLRAAEGTQIQLDFTDFSFGDSDTSCIEDYIEIRNGLTEYAPVVAKFCSKNEPYRFTSTGRFVRVRYIMSGKIQTNFRLDYKEVGSQKNDALFAFNKHGCGNSVLAEKPASEDSRRKTNKLGEWPWQAALTKKGMTTVTCGGVLISQEWILSAAHCFKRSIVTSQWLVKLGSVDIQSRGKSEQLFEIAAIRVHPNYNSSSNENDIALVKLHQPAKLNNYVNIICLPDENSDKLYENGSICHIAGWGTDRTFGDPVYPLSSMALPLVSNGECDTFEDFAVTDNMLCAGSLDGVDTCHGDGGGSLMCKTSKGFVAVGINSVGQDCGKSQHYGVYTDVRPYLDWIKLQLFT